jgi:hypothetical protein
MALYLDEAHVKKASPHQCFEKVHKPGEIAQFSGGLPVH